MLRCKNCGRQITRNLNFCPFCGRPNKSSIHVNTRGLGCLVGVLFVIVIGVIGIVSNPNSTTPAEKTGKDYESAVFSAFWEGASESFGVEYSDYKLAHTATSYISDYTTAGGQTAHYYLIKTGFETTNAFGHTTLHHVVARCYYAPDYSNTVYTTHITLDDETVYYNSETENWLMNMDGGGTAP